MTQKKRLDSSEIAHNRRGGCSDPDIHLGRPKLRRALADGVQLRSTKRAKYDDVPALSDADIVALCLGM